MNEFLQIIVSFPTVPFTVLLGVVLGYWLLVSLGALGDGLDSTAASGKAAGDALISAGKALAGKGMVDADALGLADAVDAADPSAAKGLVKEGVGGSSVLAWLGFGKVPVTVAMSGVVFWGWLYSALGSLHLLPLVSNQPGIIAKTGVLVLSVFLALLTSAFALRPLHPLFTVKELDRKTVVLGRVCTITSGKVDASFGTATFDDGGAGLLLRVACPKKNELKKGDRALIIDYDASSDTYEVEPIDWLLPEELEGIKDPARAALIAQARARAR